MPKFTEYVNKETDLKPTEVGVEADIRAGRVVGQNYTEAANDITNTGARLGSAVKEAGDVVVNFMQSRDISKGAAAEATMHENLAKAWDDTVKNADPNDPTVAQKFRDNVIEPNLEKFRDGFMTEGGGKWAESRIDALRNHLATKATADMAQKAKDAVSVNYKQTANSLSNAAMNDPSSVPFLLDQAKDGISAIVNSHANLRGVDASHATTTLTEATQESIVKAGAIGAIRKSMDPEAEAQRWSDKYPTYINGAEVKQLADAARQQLRFQRAEDRANKTAEKQDNTEAFHKAANDWEMSTTKTDPTTGAVVPVIPKNLRQSLTDIVNMPNADPGRVASMVRRAEQISVTLDDNTTRNLNARSRTNQADLYDQTMKGAITDKSAYQKAYTAGDITWEAKGQLERDFDADRSPTGQNVAARRAETIKSMEAVVDPARTSLGSKSPDGSIALDQYGQWLRGKEEEARKAGKPPQSIYDYTGPQGTGPSIAQQGANQFRVSAIQALQSRAKAMTEQGMPNGLNLTSPGGTVTGVEVKDAPPPKVGYTNKAGWVFKGGDPGKPANWEKK